MLSLMWIPALFLMAPQERTFPGLVEVYPRIFVYKGAPNDATWSSARSAGITHVFCVRRDGETGFNPDRDQRVLTTAGIAYMRLAVPKVPTASDMDLFRDIMRELPPQSKVLIHCGDGNRAAGLAFTWMVLDRRMPSEQAWSLAKGAGLAHPDTEQAVRSYVEKRKG